MENIDIDIINESKDIIDNINNISDNNKINEDKEEYKKENN